MKYQIEVTENQARVIEVACEVLARLGTGRVHEALERLPLQKPVDYNLWHRDLAVIRRLLSHHNKLGVDGYNSSLGIEMEEVSEEAKMAHDIHQSIKHTRLGCGMVPVLAYPSAPKVTEVQEKQE